MRTARDAGIFRAGSAGQGILADAGRLARWLEAIPELAGLERQAGDP